jgi:predicted secreted protein
MEELLVQMMRQPLAAEGGAESAAAATEEAVATEAQEEAPTEEGLVDIASILGTPTMKVVRSSL